MENISDLVNRFGFPIVAAVGLSGMTYYVWSWATKEIKPVLSQANATLVALIDRIRVLDNDLIRLDQKVQTVTQLRKAVLNAEHHAAHKLINKKSKILKVGKLKVSKEDINTESEADK
jgi:predicted  nucleic acid-binding Zn ribbon protein